jgi:peptidoglycan/xylan/chitin deacetylase (PgdA/CDA1 family)
MTVSRRMILLGAAGAALTAACSRATGGQQSGAGSTARTPTPGTATPTESSAPVASAPARSPRFAREVGHGDRSRPQVALTFHGNGDPALADRLLSLLEGHGVRGTVLAVGTWLQAEPRMARRIMRAGHDLGNHTWHHYVMPDLGPSAAYAEVQGCAKVLRRLTGSRRTWFRASGTQHTTETIRRAAARGGYDRCISYDVDGLDWQDPAADVVVKAVLDGARRGSIVSLHLGHPVTIDALPDVLHGLRRRGLHPVTLTELLA